MNTPESAFHMHVAEALSLAKVDGGRVVAHLEELLGLNGEVFLDLLAERLQMETLDMPMLLSGAPAFDVLPFAEAQRLCCVPLHCLDGALMIVMGDPFDGIARSRLDLLPVWRPALAHCRDVQAFLQRHEEGLRAMDGIHGGESGGARGLGTVEDLSIQRISEDSSPVVKLVHSTLYDGLKAGASDIHLETDDAGLRVKYRIDGVLLGVGQFPGLTFAEQVVSRIKVMSELDIGERRIPQDGRFKAQIQGRDVDFRVSIIPSVFGEDVVIRILDRRTLADQSRSLRLDDLGFAAETMVPIRKLASEPYGMFLVTGPTGSGKTTTLYAAISEINHGYEKIITIEDPVEYQLPGILQIPVNEKKGLTFARGLRSILRHDPDKIMVGEIRDTETAQIAIQSALTGHLVFTTVHANNVFDVLGRFLHMGVDRYNFVAALNGILAQRLVRQVCSLCAEPYVPGELELRDSGLDPSAVGGYRFMQSRGCTHCMGSGFKGRVAIAEVLVMNDEIRELIVAQEPVRRIKDAARRNGTRYLRESAMALVQAGRTTLHEINRVTFVA